MNNYGLFSLAWLAMGVAFGFIFNNDHFFMTGIIMSQLFLGGLAIKEVIEKQSKRERDAIFLLRRLRQWDMMDYNEGDGKYWREEIDKVIDGRV